MASSPIDPTLLARLERDIARTVGDRHRTLVARAAARMQSLDPPIDPAKVVDDVQQDIHDLFIDTTWPSCPRHGRHPLWYREGAWWCEQDSVAIADLGALGA